MQLLNPSRQRTLRLELPFGRTIGLAVIIFALGLVLGEALVRSHVIETHVVPDKGGGRHAQFEHQLGRLGAIVARDGPVDCIFLGNSMVWFGFDPGAFARAYQRLAGQEIRCYNFGVEALPTVSAGVLASILAAEYQPSLLIYGTSPQDYALGIESEEATAILKMPWLRYRLGWVSVEGWLSDHSRLYQYWGTMGHLLRLEDRYLLLTGPFASGLHNYGFIGRDGVRQSVAMPPDPHSEDTHVKYVYSLLSDYKMLPENLAGLEQVMALDSLAIEVLIVEMPRPLTSLHFFENGQQDQQQFIDQVESMTESRGVSFWHTTELQLIPEDGWWDYNHLNTEGARIFSEWLGEQLGSAVVQGGFQNPPARR